MQLTLPVAAVGVDGLFVPRTYFVRSLEYSLQRNENSLHTWQPPPRSTVPNEPRLRCATLPTAVRSAWQHHQRVGGVFIQPGTPGLGGLKKTKPELECDPKTCDTECLLQKTKYVLVWRRSHDPVRAYGLLRERVSKSFRRRVHVKIRLETEECMQRLGAGDTAIWMCKYSQFLNYL